MGQTMGKYAEMTDYITQMHCDSALKNNFRRVASHLVMVRPERVEDLEAIMAKHEALHRHDFGLEKRIDALEKENRRLRDKLYRRDKL